VGDLRNSELFQNYVESLFLEALNASLDEYRE
jgi:hypothetical protein